MKTIFLLGCFLVFGCLTGSYVFSQSRQDLMYSIASRDIQLTYHKTTNLVFAHNITSVDLGSASILAQKAAGVANILQLKASQEDFEPTNLSVVTEDGQLHCFMVSYSADPAELNLSFLSPKDERGIVHFSDEPHNLQELERVAHFIRNLKPHKRSLKVHDVGFSLALHGLYVHDDWLFFRLHFKNKSSIRYDIDQLRFFIRDKTKVKRTAIQEKELEIDFIDNQGDQIAAHSEETMLLAIPKLTIPKGQYLIIQLIELNGGRHVELLVQNKQLRQAEIINSLNKKNNEY